MQHDLGCQLGRAFSRTLGPAAPPPRRAQTVADRVGRNEKTKVVARLQKRGGGPPVREPAVSEEERRVMMAHYFKKQEEAKKLAEDDEDDYMTSSWANPRMLKQQLLGTASGVAVRPGMRR